MGGDKKWAQRKIDAAKSEAGEVGDKAKSLVEQAKDQSVGVADDVKRKVS